MRTCGLSSDPVCGTPCRTRHTGKAVRRCVCARVWAGYTTCWTRADSTCRYTVSSDGKTWWTSWSAVTAATPPSTSGRPTDRRRRWPARRTGDKWQRLLGPGQNGRPQPCSCGSSWPARCATDRNPARTWPDSATRWARPRRPLRTQPPLAGGHRWCKRGASVRRPTVTFVAAAAAAACPAVLRPLSPLRPCCESRPICHSRRTMATMTTKTTKRRDRTAVWIPDSSPAVPWGGAATQLIWQKNKRRD